MSTPSRPPDLPATAGDATERARRWRLVLGPDADESAGVSLAGTDAGMDQALQALYGSSSAEGGARGPDRRGGLGSSAPSVARWLGDIRSYFPSTVVRVMQRDALERLDLQRMLLEPELPGAALTAPPLPTTLNAAHNCI